MERHVDPRRDAGGGDDRARVDEAVVGPHVDAEVAQRVDRAPVRRRGATVEETRRLEYERARADAGDELARRAEVAYAREHALVGADRTRVAARDEQHVD